MGRWTNRDAANTFCQMCHTEVEDEYQFMFRYNQYELRRNLFVDILNMNNFG